MNVRKEIREHAAEEDKPVLLFLFDRYHWESQWAFVAFCRHERYGVKYHETYRVWSPTLEGRLLYEARSKEAAKEATQEAKGAVCPLCGEVGRIEFKTAFYLNAITREGDAVEVEPVPASLEPREYVCRSCDAEQLNLEDIVKASFDGVWLELVEDEDDDDEEFPIPGCNFHV